MGITVGIIHTPDASTSNNTSHSTVAVMAAGKHTFALEKDMPLKEMVAGLEPLMPVGMRGMSLIEPAGTDAKGEVTYEEFSLSGLQAEIHMEDEHWDWDKNCFKPEKFDKTLPS